MFRVLYYTFRREIPWNHRGAKFAFAWALVAFAGLVAVLYGTPALTQGARAFFQEPPFPNQPDFTRMFIGVGGLYVFGFFTIRAGLFADRFQETCKTLLISREQFSEMTSERRSELVADCLTYRLDKWREQMKTHGDNLLFEGIRTAEQLFRSEHKTFKDFKLIGGEPETFLDAARIASEYSLTRGGMRASAPAGFFLYQKRKWPQACACSC